MVAFGQPPRPHAATPLGNDPKLVKLFRDAHPNADPAKTIKEIKSSKLYRAEAAPDNGSNWLARALMRVKLPDINLPSPKVNPDLPPVNIGFEPIVILVYLLLAAAIIVLVFLAVRAFDFHKKAAARKASTMLDEDEPDRPLDEWLELSASLEAEGRFREAIRCLYVACLLRFDTAGVGRFDRTQTNWEHYRRLTAATKYPSGFDFRSPTQEFDHVWYGFKPVDRADVAAMRAVYKSLTEQLENRRLQGAA